MATEKKRHRIVVTEVDLLEGFPGGVRVIALPWSADMTELKLLNKGISGDICGPTASIIPKSVEVLGGWCEWGIRARSLPGRGGQVGRGPNNRPPATLHSFFSGP